MLLFYVYFVAFLSSTKSLCFREGGIRRGKANHTKELTGTGRVSFQRAPQTEVPLGEFSSSCTHALALTRQKRHSGAGRLA